MSRRRGDYGFRGRALAVSAATLEEAVSALADLWNSVHSLVMHVWGSLILDIVVDDLAAHVEITDPDILDAALDGDLGPLISFLANRSGLSDEEMTALLSRVDAVDASVDKIRPPNDPYHWKTPTDADPAVVMPVAIERWSPKLTEGLVKRGKGARQSARIVETVVRVGRDRGRKIGEIARETGLPQSTLRDAEERARRRARRALSERKPGQKLGTDERRTIVEMHAVLGNAAEVGRRLDIAPRTVRDIVGADRTAADVRGGYDKVAAKRAVMRAVGRGVSASEAARRAGVPERTARGWAAAKKKGK